MAFQVHVGDKITKGNNVAVTVKSTEGAPSAQIALDGVELKTTLKLLDTDKYKIRFYVPASASGELSIKISGSGESFQESFAIAAG